MTKSFYTQRPASSAERMTSETQDAKEVEVRDSWWVWRVVASKKWVQEIDEEQNVLKQHVQKVESVLNQHVQNVDNLTKSNAMELSTKLQETQSTHSHLAAQIKNVDASCQKHIEDLNRWVSCTSQRLNWVEGGDMMSQLHKGFAKLDKGLETIDQKIGEYNKIQLDITHKLTIQKEMVKKQLQTWDSPDAASTLKRQLSDEIDRKIKPLKDSVEQALEKLQKIEDGQKRLERIDEIEDDMKEKWTLVEAVQTSVEIEFPKITQLEKGMQSLKAEVAGLKTLEATMASRAFVQTLQANLESQLEELKVKTSCREAHEDQQASLPHQLQKQLKKMEGLEAEVAMQKEQVEKISGLEASAAAQKEGLEALKVSMTKHAKQLQTMESLEADVSRQKEQLGTLKVSMTNQEKKQLQKTESLEADMAMQKEQVEKISGLEASAAAQKEVLEALKVSMTKHAKQLQTMESLEADLSRQKKQLGTLKVSMTNQEKKQLQKTESLETNVAMQKEQVEKISGLEASAAAQKEVLEALKVSMTKHATQLQTMESLEADVSRQKEQLGTLKVSMTNQEKKQLQKTESLEADMAMQKEQVEKVSGLVASAAAQKEVLEALKVSMTEHAKQLQTMESLEADVSRQKEQLGTLKVSMTNQEKKQLQKTESLEADMAMQKEQVEKISGRLEAEVAAQQGLQQQLDKVKTAVKKQEQQARLSNPGTDPRSAAVESVDLKSKFDLWMQNSNLPRQLEKLKQGLLARLSKLEDALEPLEMERLTGMERTIQQEVLPQLQHLQIRIESLGRGPPQADGGSRGSSSPRFTQTTQPQVCRLSVSLLSGREARIDITSQMRIAALKDAAERELECSIYALFKEERRLDLDKSVGEAQLQDGDALQAVVGQAKAFCGFTWPEKPQDLNSLHRTLSVEQQLHAARDSDESVEQRSKLVKTVQLELHPDKGGTDEAQIWLEEWLKEHLEWFFEPHQVPETLRRKYQGDETV
ncbi:Laminin subunit alpha-1 (Laminin A chain) (Laminin-1 subunit alpha) (Laminin-3 subunit alpha) (S-laminin subunit alpha) (S-LAM alpha) [Durusdinium trenchii]|uniref:Laminin subunit alpha-1 (Laminin A chain) (Laminin-1 subunit alpha) (Laminin-3 subunit alpha) (S-laminin subunit alpha) (S-LAM alpha) n=1 Tax=Durusdinium trenchii TaxID=1381693 RepID=A0ABP0RLW1_9DINO